MDGGSQHLGSSGGGLPDPISYKGVWVLLQEIFEMTRRILIFNTWKDRTTKIPNNIFGFCGNLGVFRNPRNPRLRTLFC